MMTLSSLHDARPRPTSVPAAANTFGAAAGAFATDFALVPNIGLIAVTLAIVLVGKPLVANQVVRAKLTEMHRQVAVARSYTLEVAQRGRVLPHGDP